MMGSCATAQAGSRVTIPTIPSWALRSPKTVVSLLYPLLFPLPLLGSCSWLCSLAMLQGGSSSHRQRPVDKSKGPESRSPQHHGSRPLLLPQSDPSIFHLPSSPSCQERSNTLSLRVPPARACPQTPRSCGRPQSSQARSHPQAAATSSRRSRTATKKPWVRVSAAEARRQLSAPGKAASPRQGQQGKASTSLQRGTRVRARPRSACPASPNSRHT